MATQDADGASGTIYRIPIWDVATPAFVSSGSYAYGTESDLRRFMSARRRNLQEGYLGNCSVAHDELLRAYDAWEEGDSPTANVAFHEQPFMHCVGVPVACSHDRVGEYDETYVNIYGLAYAVHASSVTYDVLLVEEDGYFRRLVRSDVTGLAIGSDERMRLVSDYWGEPGMFEISEPGTLSMTMFLEVNSYKSGDEAERNLCEGLSLAPAIGQIVADG